MIKLHLTFICILCISSSFNCISQNTFFHTYGGSGDDKVVSVYQTPEGGYLAAGETVSFGAGSKDVYLLLTDSVGQDIWTKTYGGTGEDYALTISKTLDSAYIIGAHTGSFGQGGHDYYLIKTNLDGDSIYTRVFGGPSPDGIYQINEWNGGYIMAGHTTSFGAGAHDFYAIQVSNLGDTIWTRTWGGPGADNLRGMAAFFEPVNIPKMALIGESNSYGAGGFDILLIKTDSNINLELEKVYGNSGNEYGYAIIETDDLGFLIIGHTNSSGAGLYDVYLIKIDFFGNVEWSKTYGGTSDDFAYFAQKTSDGGFIITGSTTSFGGGGKDVYLIKTDANGNMLWSKAYGDSGNEEAWSVKETMDGGYILSGFTNSFGLGNDALLIKTDSIGNTSCYSYNTSTIVDTAITMVSTPTVQTATGAFLDGTNTQVDSVTSNSNSCPIVGIDETIFQNDLAEIYPNPSRNVATLNFRNPSKQNFNLFIYNSQGQIVRTIDNITTNQVTIEKKNLRPGIYFIRLHDAFDKYTSVKLIIE